MKFRFFHLFFNVHVSFHIMQFLFFPFYPFIFFPFFSFPFLSFHFLYFSFPFIFFFSLLSFSFLSFCAFFFFFGYLLFLIPFKSRMFLLFVNDINKLTSEFLENVKLLIHAGGFSPRTSTIGIHMI
jgi:hypothetical protein